MAIVVPSLSVTEPSSTAATPTPSMQLDAEPVELGRGVLMGLVGEAVQDGLAVVDHDDAGSIDRDALVRLGRDVLEEVAERAGDLRHRLRRRRR